MRDPRFLLKTHYTRSRALVIGIDQYTQAPPLEYAVSDADEFRQTLVDSLGFETDEITYLVNEAATRQSILRAFLRFSREDIDVDERLVVFYAGHGHTRTGSRGEIGYLVPHDADMADFSTFIRWDEFTRNSELVRAKHVLFIMDACYGGLALTRSIGPGGARFLKDMMLRHSRQVLTAGKADEVVADSGGPLPNHSVFTGHLLEGMRGKAATEDGVITAAGLMAYVYNRVATDKNSNQTPHYGHFDGDGDLVLIAPGLSALEASEERDDDRLISIPFAMDEPTEEGILEKVKRAKKLLSNDSSAIELHDLLANEVRRFLSITSEDSFPTSGQFTKEEMLDRISRYEDSAADLSLLLACIAHWGKTTHTSTMQKCIARSSDRLESRGGLTIWLELRWYPLILELYTAGIAAIDAQRYDNLAALFYTQLPSSEYRDKNDTFVEAISNGLLELTRMNAFKQIPGHERHYAPHSEYLFKILQPRLDDTFFLGKNYETAFDEFEVFFALAIADIEMAKNGRVWGPIGRFGWKNRNRDNGPLARIIKDARSRKESWPPFRAGMFGGDFERFDKVATEYLQLVGGLNWF
ncbi:caspase family protein [Sulfuritalea hydrogenivorans]|uniref:Peptidase C14 caspase catalytic subunit p20 n=1 Tax=Sulfuritalea hydrogenivorans sk43H TaxID=1223802 RepID=W0SJD0_9PROT|nr:caspase family protein [Sulfuritalea hydrogenivorans]BAO30173.1 peptidase C14 caspase catalytic subunit p20 [Sulfuritalea hydrogenivorans sk43H]